jgi:predicted amidophosphoribosyltransferase
VGLLGLVLPIRCAGCGVPGDALCAACAAGLVRIAPPVCERCGCPGAWPVRRCVECTGRRLGFATARAAIVYDARARPLVSAWKERGRRDLAGPFATIVERAVPRPQADILTFVPGDRERGRNRGHVPAARLARELGAVWGIPVAPLLERSESGRRQAGLAQAERRTNVRGLFRARGQARGCVVLVDDVYTTGATAAACATALRKAGAGAVEVVCLARAVR